MAQLNKAFGIDMKQLLEFVKLCKNGNGEYTINLYGRIGKSSLRKWLTYCLGSFVKYTENDEHQVTLYFDDKNEHSLSIYDRYDNIGVNSERVLNVVISPPQSTNVDFVDAICTSEVEMVFVRYING